MALLNLTPGPPVANDGAIGKLDYPVGNKRWGQRMFLSGVESPIEVRTPIVQTPFAVIPGVISGAAYASGDSLGVRFEIGVPTSGLIVGALLADLDKEDIATDFILFNQAFTGGTDNSTFDMADADYIRPAGVLIISSFVDFNDNSLGYWYGVKAYSAPAGKLWVQAITRGAPNLTTANDYALSLIIENHS